MTTSKNKYHNHLYIWKQEFTEKYLSTLGFGKTNKGACKGF